MTELELSAEDAKLVTLARATRARTGAPVAAAVRDLDGRTYAAASVDMPSLQVSALGVCVAMAFSSGSRGLEAVVVMGGGPELSRLRRRPPPRVRGRRRGGASRLTADEIPGRPGIPDVRWRCNDTKRSGTTPK